MEIAERLRRHEPVSDEEFDRLLGPKPREASPMFWSSVRVAQVAAQWLRAMNASRVLDVGAGPGKACCVLALTSNQRTWGLERRRALVEEGRALAVRLTADVVLMPGELQSVDSAQFDGFYFYNPFAEYLEDYDRYDELVTPSAARYLHDVRIVERWLRDAPVGTALVTYNGLGGRIPVSWTLLRTKPLAGNVLRLWAKERARSDETEAFVEVGEDVLLASTLARLVRLHPQTPLEGTLLQLLAGSDWPEKA